jgi:uncharacterized repeat protein (TIGR01451 family)
LFRGATTKIPVFGQEPLRSGVAFAGRACATFLAAVLGLVLAACPSVARAQDALCAQVKIEIQQKLSLERQAFNAVMRIDNGLATSSIDDVGINLTFQDQAGNTVVATSDPNNTSAGFFVTVDSLAGIAAIDGSGTVAPKTTGEIHWLIIPATGTGGTQPQGKMFFVGATLTYSVAGTASTVTVTPDFITVKPQPLLQLDYFLAGDVYADDAFTTAIEPPVPFTLGVRIKNVGGGIAAKTSIESAQPQIIDNQQGLLVGFQILDGYVNDRPAGKTLLLNFGDIGPGASEVGRWDMITTLSGRFTDFQAGFTHADSLGGALTSLIQSVTTHQLVHDVMVDLPGRDAVRDFLALDVDVYRVYESDGIDTQAVDQSPNARLQAGASGQFNLNFPATTGFAYVSVTDPLAGQSPPGAVVRSDGKTLPPENVWLSKRRNANLTWSYFINFFDVNSTGSYTMAFASGNVASLIGSVYVDSNNNASRDTSESGVASATVTLNGIDGQGSNVNTSVETAADGSYQFVALQPGTYSLAIAPVAGYVDGTHHAGTAGGGVSANGIANILLVAGANASGYLFAKRLPTQTASADVGVTMAASRTRVPAGGTVVFSIVASNSGPSTASGAQVTDRLPAALNVTTAVTSSGSYSASTGIWTIGDVASGGSAMLTLTATLTNADAPVTNTVTIASTVSDPNTSNNAASITLNPNAGTLQVSQAVLPETRVLVLISCPGGGAADDSACIGTRTAFLANYLDAVGVIANVVNDTDSFRTAMRFGRYNTYWISGGGSKLTGTLAQEVREAVLRGDSLLVDGLHDAVGALLDPATGITLGSGSLGSNQSITVTGGTTFVTAGSALIMSLNGGTVQATFDGASPAIVQNTYGQGRARVMGFDLVATLQQPALEAPLHNFFLNTMDALAPAASNSAVGAAYLPLTVTIANGATAATVAVTTSLPAGVTAVDATPPPTSSDASHITWQLTLAPAQTQFIDLGLRMPSTSGNYPVSTVVSLMQGGTSTLFGTYGTTLTVAGSDQFSSSLTAGLQALALTATGERASRDAAVQQLQAAQQAIVNHRRQEAIGELVSAREDLAQIASIATASYQLQIDQWIAESERQWYLALPLCGSADAAPQSDWGEGFYNFNDSERFEARGGASNGVDWAVALGGNVQQTGGFTGRPLAWITGHVYSWSVVMGINGTGLGKFSTSATAPGAYSGSPPLHAGNMLQFHVRALDSAGAATINAAVQSVGGFPVSATLATPGNSRTSDAYTYFYYPGLTTGGGASTAGTLGLNFSGGTAPPDAQLDFTISAGNSACRVQ